MKRRAFLGLGATSIGVGALYGTGAFSSVSAGRGISVNATKDAHALLGIEGTGPEDSLKITNNATNDQNITLDAVEDDIVYKIDEEEKPDPTTIQLDPDESQKVLFESTGGREEITIDFTGEIAANQTVIKLQRPVEIPQADQITLTANVENAGNSGFFEFEIENEGEVDVTIEDVAVNDATVVDDKNSDLDEIDERLEDRDGNKNAEGPIEVLGRAPTDEDFVAFSEPIDLNQGATNEFRTRKLVDEDGDDARYNNGGTLDITLRLEDGSTALLEMEV